MLGITDFLISSPPSSAPITQHRPAVTFKNTGNVPAYTTGTLLIRNVASGRVEYSGQLSGDPVAPGVTGTAQCSQLWTPTAGQTYTVEASIFTGNADNAASATAPPLTVTAQGAVTPGATPSVKITLPGAKPFLLVFHDEDGKSTVPTIQYPFYFYW